MTYSFTNLSPADFEDLVRDLIGAELHVRFEAFAAGPDGGIDGRHAKVGESIILQAKHYAGSTFSALKSQMKRERASIDSLSPTRYILTTSRPLTPGNKKELAAIIGPCLQSEGDICGPKDLNSFLRKFPKIVHSHIKLWLSGAAELERILHSASYTYTNITKDEIKTKIQLYAPNPSFDCAREILEKHHFIIISGPPGVGKTTLAEILTYAYTSEEWELTSIRSLDDGFSSINDSKNQVFFFDDFLGKIALDRRALSHKDSELAKFIKRISTSPNARFILTTRAYIFEEARRVSEYLSDPGFNITKYVLDVGIYTRRIKARILYNHLLYAGTPQQHTNALVNSDLLTKIIDHKNYNPRVIEWMTDSANLKEVEPKSYPESFLNALEHPGRLWDIAFRTHIPKKCQHLLFALFFSSQYRVEMGDLRVSYDLVHNFMCMKYGDSNDPKDFEEALHILEGGFISIQGKLVDFINPSLRDYLSGYLDDVKMLQGFASSARQTDWAKAVWKHGKQLDLTDEELSNFALSFINVAEEFPNLPTWKRKKLKHGTFLQASGIPNTARIELLIAWWEASKDQRFSNLALKLSKFPVDGLDPWHDGGESIQLLGRLRSGDYPANFPQVIELADNIELACIAMVNKPMPIDELEAISDAVIEHMDTVSDEINVAVTNAIQGEFFDVRSFIEEIESESTLNEHAETLQRLADRVNVTSQEVDRALDIINERIYEIEEYSSVSESPSFSGSSSTEEDTFEDTDLKNLFVGLFKK